MRILGEALVALLSTCSVGDVPPDLVKAVLKQESQHYVYALSGSYDQSDFSRTPSTEEEIVETYLAAEESVRRGINVSMGLMQVNSYWIGEMGYTVAQLFDPCNSVGIGTSLLSESMDRLCGCHYTRKCIVAALREYNTGSSKESKAGRTYSSKVIKRIESPDFFSNLPETRATQACALSR